MVQFDLPAMLTYVLRHTHNTQLAYVGHSQGTQIMFGLLSLAPEWNDVVNPFIALAPVAFLRKIVHPAQLATPFTDIAR